MGELYRLLQKKRALFFWTGILTLSVLVIYPLAGALMMAVVFRVTGVEGGFSHLDEGLLAPVRAVQSIGQLLFLGMPVFFLAGLQTGQKQMFSGENFRFLGLGRRPTWRVTMLAVLGVVLLQPLIYLMIQYIGHLLSLSGETGRMLLEDQLRLERFLFFLAGADSVPEFLVVAFVIAVVPAFCEEVFFRGFIQRNYVLTISPARGVLVAGFVFGLFHLSPVNLLPLTAMGWYLGYVYYRSGNLLVPVAVHFSNNMLSLMVLQLQRGNPEAHAGASLPGVAPGLLLPLAALSLALFVAAVYRFNRITVDTVRAGDAGRSRSSSL